MAAESTLPFSSYWPTNLFGIFPRPKNIQLHLNYNSKCLEILNSVFKIFVLLTILSVHARGYPERVFATRSIRRALALKKCLKNDYFAEFWINLYFSVLKIYMYNA